nr:hypothetical protein [Psychrobacter sp. PraFG1]UNK05129.1 hypothetical protein MN210_14185 [Psychrobacter sp. PraFG1]
MFGVNEYLGNNNLGLLKFGFHWLTKYGKELPDLQGLQTLNAFRKIATVKPKNPWLYDYFSQGVVRHGDYMGKIRITPTKSAKQKIKQPKIHLFTKDEAIRPVLLDEIRTHDYEYDVQIQLCRNVKKQPIEKITQEWDESKAPFVTIGKLTIPKQEVTDDGNFAAMEHLSFSVFRALKKTVQLDVFNSLACKPIAPHLKFAMSKMRCSAVSRPVLNKFLIRPLLFNARGF